MFPAWEIDDDRSTALLDRKVMKLSLEKGVPKEVNRFTFTLTKLKPPTIHFKHGRVAPYEVAAHSGGVPWRGRVITVGKATKNTIEFVIPDVLID